MLGGKRGSDRITQLLIWSGKNSRRFPWRSKSGAYRILVAEKLLQQTAVRDSVVRAYLELTACYPNAASLANADIQKLTEIIKPLGFAYRAKELKTLGQALVVNHKGRVPRDLDSLLSLPGVGDYAARAVLSFAFGRDVPVVDTNVARFLHRFFGLRGRLPSNPARNKKLLRIAAGLVPTGRSREFNYAVLDLCANICTSRNPKCQICPLQDRCVVGSRLTLRRRKAHRHFIRSKVTRKLEVRRKTANARDSLKR
jgi:A/G-specific adenine glycosylase